MSQIGAFVSDLTDTKDVVSIFKNEIKRLEKELEQCRRTPVADDSASILISHLKEQLHKKNSENIDLKAQIKETTSLYNQSEQTMNQLMHEHELYTKHLGEIEKQKTELEQAADQIITDLQKQKKELEEEKTELKQAANQIIETAKQEIGQLQSALTEEKSAKHAAATKLQHLENALNAANEANTKENTDLQKKKEKLQKEKEKLQKEKDELQQSLVEATTEQTKLHEEKTELERRLESVSLRASEAADQVQNKAQDCPRRGRYQVHRAPKLAQ